MALRAFAHPVVFPLILLAPLNLGCICSSFTPGLFGGKSTPVLRAPFPCRSAHSCVDLHLSATFPPPFRHPSAILHPSAARVSVSHICPHLQHVLQNRIIGGHNVLFWALGAGLLQHLYVPVTRKQSCAPSLVSSHPVWLLAQPSSSWTLLRWTLLENSCNPSLAP